jgi:hypothetical protein
LSGPDRREIQLAWLKECGADLRARTQAEYLYTAAALTLFGGVYWGVASQHRLLTIIAALFVIALVTYTVCRKIFEDHQIYLDIWASRSNAASNLSENIPYIFPEKIKQASNGSDHASSLRVLLKEVFEPNKSPGYVFSLHVLFLSALGSAIFCLTFICSS